MFELVITPAVNDNTVFVVFVNGNEVARVDKRGANLWRAVSDADQVFVSDAMALATEHEPVVLVRFRLAQAEMEAFLRTVMYTYDAYSEGPLHLGWDEIDPSLRTQFRRDADDMFESESWNLDECAEYPLGQPFIVIHPEKVGGMNETAFIELYYVILEEQ